MAAALVAIVLAAAAACMVGASDPELTIDYASKPATTNSSFFAFTGFRGGVTAASGEFLAKKASQTEFPALIGLGVSFAKLSFQPGSINPPHTHPRGTELLFLEQGCLTVGLIDSNNTLFQQVLEKGDVFVFPKGLVHFQINHGKEEAKAISSFSSSAAGTVSLPRTLFNSGIDTAVLAKAFKVKNDVIEQLKNAISV